MASNMPISLVEELEKDSRDIFSVFDLPHTDTSIVRTTSIRAELATNLTRNSKESIFIIVSVFYFTIKVPYLKHDPCRPPLWH